MKHSIETYYQVDFERLQNDLDEILRTAKARISNTDLYYSIFWVVLMHCCFVAGIISSVLHYTAFAIILFVMYAMFMASNRHSIWHGAFDKFKDAPAWIRPDFYGRGFLGTMIAGAWFIPADTWIYAHNRIHHYYTSENGIDADNTVYDIKHSSLPRFIKPILIGIASPFWAILYSIKTLDLKSGVIWKYKPWHIFRLQDKKIRRIWSQTLLPLPIFILITFLLLKLVVGHQQAINTIIDIIIGITIGTVIIFVGIMVNHCGFDLFRVSSGRYKSKGEFYFQQALTSANFERGNHLWDNLFSFLNYQIEHHLFPKLPVYQYRLIQKDVEQALTKNGLPYNKGPLLYRFVIHTLYYAWSKQSHPELDWDALRAYRKVSNITDRNNDTLYESLIEI